ncbi:disease resistance protein RPV1 [Trifolium repens]|nr:disease resistance protein RPV1 [Trifolium repens]
MAYRSSGASQIIYSRQYRNSGSKTLPNGIVATRPSKLEMRPLWYSGINHRISKQQLNLWAIAGAKKKTSIWRRALKISANLSGITSSGFQNDVELLEEIINHVLKTLSNNPIITKGLIGIGKPIAHLDSLLRQESEKVRVIGIWDRESDNSMVAGLERLKDKALITISIDNVISMHDIIQEMGREIVRQESSEDPSKRSRLWDPDEICDVFKIVKGTDALPAIRSIRADLSVIRKLKLSSHVFAKMTNLKFLDFNGWYDQDCFDLQGPQSFPSGLRYLHWIHYPLKSFPEKFSAENLVILDLSRGLVEKLWSGVQDLVNLKEVRLSNSILLKELPDFSKATSLNVLLMEHCPRLESVHPSIFSLEKLVQLDLSLCFSLATFTSSSHLSSLHYLNLGFCTNLSKFSATFKNIIELDLTAIPINALPPSIGFQSKLETLVLKLSEIESIPSSIKNLTRLKKLDIQRCKKLLALPELPSSLETLLVECKSLKTVLFPSTAAEQFKENKKRVEFWNCLNLDERSLINIGFNMQINLMKFAYQHLSTLEHDYVESYVDYKDNFSSYQAVYVYPGSSVPEWFEYKTTENEMIVDLSSHLSPLLGFVFCFILVEDYK